MDPRAEEKVAAANPIGMIGHQTAILPITNWFESNSEGVAETANLKAMKT